MNTRNEIQALRSRAITMAELLEAINEQADLELYRELASAWIDFLRRRNKSRR